MGRPDLKPCLRQCMVWPNAYGLLFRHVHGFFSLSLGNPAWNIFSNMCMQFQCYSVTTCGEQLSNAKLLKYPSCKLLIIPQAMDNSQKWNFELGIPIPHSQEGEFLWDSQKCTLSLQFLGPFQRNGNSWGFPIMFSKFPGSSRGGRGIPYRGREFPLPITVNFSLDVDWCDCNFFVIFLWQIVANKALEKDHSYRFLADLIGDGLITASGSIFNHISIIRF